jgi:transposase
MTALILYVLPNSEPYANSKEIIPIPNTFSFLDLETKDLYHCGIVVGIVDELGLVEEIDRIVGIHPQQVVSTGQVVKAMILNGLGFVAAPLYLFEEFFIGKATEHLIGEGVRPEHFNDDRLGRALDQLWAGGLTQIFMNVAMQAYRQQDIVPKSVHLDSSTFHLHGAYKSDTPQALISLPFR